MADGGAGKGEKKAATGSAVADAIGIFAQASGKIMEVMANYRFTSAFILFAAFMGAYGWLSGDMQSAVDWIAFVASAIAAISIVVTIYALYRLIELRSEEDKKLGIVFTWRAEQAKKNARWEKVEEYIASAHPSDWKIAILEADNILDEIVKRMGYKGETLGERMKTIEASDFPYLDEAWEVHKVRNQIAHKGTDYPLARTEAENAIDSYHRIFKALNYL